MVKIKNIISVKYGVPVEWITAYLPTHSFVPLCDENSRLEPFVKIGDRVREGQILAYGNDVSCNVHSPLPGIVKDFSETILPSGSTGRAALVELEGSFTHLGRNKRKKKTESLNSRKIINTISDKGIVNTFKYPYPLAQQIRQKLEGSHETLVVRLYDLDPSCCTDSFVFNSFMMMVFEGAVLTAQALDAQNIVFLYDSQNTFLKNPSEDILNLFGSLKVVFIPINTSWYPCGGPNEIVDLVHRSKKEEIPVSISDMMTDTVTLYSVYEAVTYNMPVMDRFVHVLGDGVQQQKMFKVRIGTPISSLIEECGGFVGRTGRVVVNGLIRGNEVSDLSAPVTKSLKSVCVMLKKEQQDRHPYACVHCGMCRRVCPAKLQPDAIYAHVGSYVSDAERCYDCGLCNAACTSRLPLNQTIRELIAEKDVTNV